MLGLLVLFGLARFCAERAKRHFAPPGPECSPPHASCFSSAAQLGLALLAAFAVSVFAVSAFAPPLLYDVTEYHLGAFRDYASAASPRGRFIAMPHNFYARFPFPVEAVYFLGLLLEHPRDFSPKLINLGFLLADAMLIWAWLRRAGAGRTWRMLAVLAFFAHPVALEVSLDAYIDPAALFFVLASVYTMLVCGGALPAHSKAAPELLPVCGLLFGVALSAKYTVAQLYLLPIAAFVAPPAILSSMRSGGWRLLVRAGLLFLLPVSLWLGKNAVLYGNPLEPFFERLFRPSDLTAISLEKFYVESHYPQSLLSLQYWFSLAPRLSSIGWFILAPLAGLCFAANRRSWIRVFLLCIVAYLSWNMVRESQARFLLPVIAMSIVMGAWALSSLPSGLARGIVSALVVIWACGGLFSHALRIGSGGEFTYFAQFVLGGASQNELRADFLARNLGALGEVLKTANTRVPAEGRILLVYEARPYLFLRKTVYNTVFDESVLLRQVTGARSASEVREKLRRAGITHVLVNREELRRFIDQYARPSQLARFGVRKPMQEFALIPAPENLYPPFFRSPDWTAMRPPVAEFLTQLRASAIATAGRAPAEVYLSPL